MKNSYNGGKKILQDGKLDEIYLFIIFVFYGYIQKVSKCIQKNWFHKMQLLAHFKEQLC